MLTELIEIDDGHKPGKTDAATLIAVHKTEKFVSSFDNILPTPWLSRAYEYAKGRGKPWGVYIDHSDASDESSNDPEYIWNTGDQQRAIALVALRHLIYVRGRAAIGEDLFSLIKGTAIWCLVSGTNDAVDYHIDYAELYRYETNIIHPPVVAGTCHLSPLVSRAGILEDAAAVSGLNCMDGGDFNVNLEGINHYASFGYKGKLQSESALDWDMANNPNWRQIPYRCNRGIIHSGSLPHYSSKIVGLSSEEKRVILGFNCFGSDSADAEALIDRCRRAPEHSDAFNRTVKLYQALSLIEGTGVVNEPKYHASSNSHSNIDPSSSSHCARHRDGKKLTVEHVKSNPALRKLIMAAALRVKLAAATSSNRNNT